MHACPLLCALPQPQRLRAFAAAFPCPLSCCLCRPPFLRCAYPPQFLSFSFSLLCEKLARKQVKGTKLLKKPEGSSCQGSKIQHRGLCVPGLIYLCSIYVYEPLIWFPARPIVCTCRCVVVLAHHSAQLLVICSLVYSPMPPCLVTSFCVPSMLPLACPSACVFAFSCLLM